MKALILAAGKGTRLGTLSRDRPKCLQEIAGAALLDRLERQLSEAGVTELLINTHHLAECVELHISSSAYADRVKTSHEPELLGTLGTLKAACGTFNGEGGWVLHADNFILGSLCELHRAFVDRPSRTWGVMLAFRTSSPSTCGIITSDSDGVLLHFEEKPMRPEGNLASAATFIFDERVFQLAQGLRPHESDISRHLLPRLLGRLLVVEHPLPIVDIGTPAGLQRAQSLCTR
jgi:mannose-1-phosphate guanylyltransferase